MIAIQLFFDDESGAVTVDWVVLTAAMIGFCLFAYGVIENSSRDLAAGAANAILADNDGFIKP